MTSEVMSLKVGDRVYMRDANENRRRDPAFVPPLATVTKVARKYVFVDRDRVGYLRVDGRRNDDGVGCRHIQTIAQRASEVAVRDAAGRLFACGLVPHHGMRVSHETLVAFADAVEAVLKARSVTDAVETFVRDAMAKAEELVG